MQNFPKRTPFSPEQLERAKEANRQMSKRHREWLKSLSPEALAEYKQNKIYDKERRERLKQDKIAAKVQKAYNKRELAILKFMLKNDVLYFHHGYSESMKSKITEAINSFKNTDRPRHDVYDPYIWNYQGEGRNYMPKSQLGCLFSGNKDCPTIYDVPLDGSFKFHIYDSGQRGSGSFNCITATKVEVAPVIPFVNPGALIPITA